jgi:anti-sigma factor RsiW
MSSRPISPEQGPTSQRLAVFTDGRLAAEQSKQVRAWLAGHREAQAQADAETEANRRLLRVFSATRPKEPSPAACEETLTRIEAALLARCAPPGNARPVQALPAPVATGSVASIRRKQS